MCTAGLSPAAHFQFVRPLTFRMVENLVRMLALMVAAASVSSSTMYAQQPGVRRDPYPDWIDADSNLVDADWALGTITRNTLYVTFKPDAPEEARVAAVRLVHGTVIQQRDSVPLTYLIRVASHPNACAVKQALARLKTLPQVAATLPHLIWVMDSLGNLHKVPGAAKGPPTPCPSGYGLLR